MLIILWSISRFLLRIVRVCIVVDDLIRICRIEKICFKLKLNDSLGYAVITNFPDQWLILRKDSYVIYDKNRGEIIMVDEADIVSKLEQLRTESTLSGRERYRLPEMGRCHNSGEITGIGIIL